MPRDCKIFVLNTSRRRATNPILRTFVRSFPWMMAEAIALAAAAITPDEGAKVVSPGADEIDISGLIGDPDVSGKGAVVDVGEEEEDKVVEAVVDVDVV